MTKQKEDMKSSAKKSQAKPKKLHQFQYNPAGSGLPRLAELHEPYDAERGHGQLTIFGWYRSTNQLHVQGEMVVIYLSSPKTSRSPQRAGLSSRSDDGMFSMMDSLMGGMGMGEDDVLLQFLETTYSLEAADIQVRLIAVDPTMPKHVELMQSLRERELNQGADAGTNHRLWCDAGMDDWFVSIPNPSNPRQDRIAVVSPYRLPQSNRQRQSKPARDSNTAFKAVRNVHYTKAESQIKKRPLFPSPTNVSRDASGTTKGANRKR